MAKEIKEVRRRIRTTSQIRRVTSTLQRVSAARLARDSRAVARSENYLRRLTQTLERILGDVSDPIPRMMPGKGQGMGLLVFSSDRGLCGGFNSVVIEQVEQVAASASRDDLWLLVVGKIGARRLRRAGWPVAEVFERPVRAAGDPLGIRLADLLARGFMEGRVREVRMVFTRFVSGLRQEAVSEPLLPLALARDVHAGFGPVEFEPSPADLLARLLPEYLRQRVENALINSLMSEDAARQLAMGRASDNAAGILGELTKTYSRLRQDSITTEMIELSASRVDTR